MKPTYIRVRFIGLDTYYLTIGPYDTEVELNYDLNKIKDGSFTNHDILYINHRNIAYIVTTDKK